MKSSRLLKAKSHPEWDDLTSTAMLLAAQYSSHEDDAPESPTKKQHLDSLPPDYSMIQLMDILRCMPVEYRSLIPYILTLELFKRHTEVYVRQTYRHIYPKVDERHFEHSTTSCINTALSVVSLFSSAKTTTNLQLLSNQRKSTEIALALPSSKPWYFRIRNLFNGMIVSALQKDMPDYAKKKIDSKTYDLYAERVNDTFFESLRVEADRCRAQFTDDEAFIKAMKKYMVSLEFNGPVITTMREHINENVIKTDQQNSHLYYMSCVMPNKNVHHAFVLEQFYCSSTDSVRFRLYQSWLKRSTLHATLSDQFSHLYAHSWDQKELYEFINKLEAFYSNSQPEQISEKDTFGLGHSSRGKLFASTFFTDELVGASFEYYCQPMNPAACLDHLLEIAGDQSPLREALQELPISRCPTLPMDLV